MSKTKLDTLVESRCDAAKMKKVGLVEAWADVLNPLAEHVKIEEGRDMDAHELEQTAQVLENASLQAGKKSSVFEATDSSAVSFLGVQLPVIAAVMPSLIMNRVASVQALDRRIGAVFYLSLKYGQKKGDLPAGGTLLDPKTGHARSASSMDYASENVHDESIGVAGSTHYTGTLDYASITAGTLTITNGVETFQDNGSGVMVSSLGAGGSSGTVVYSAGTYDVTFAASSVAAPKAVYQFNHEKLSNGVPEVDVQLTQEPVTAEDFMLRSKYTLAAAMDLEKAHGISFDDVITKHLGAEVKFAIDRRGINKIVQTAENQGIAAPTFGSWDASISGGKEWAFHKFQLIDYIIKGSNSIFNKTLRAHANFIICGNNGARVICQLAPNFVPSADFNKIAPKGPIVIGKLDGREVIQDPFLDPDKIYLGYKGDDVLESGMIYAPYIPLFTTPAIQTSDLVTQKGFYSAAGYKIVNAGFFSFGSITGLG